MARARMTPGDRDCPDSSSALEACTTIVHRIPGALPIYSTEVAYSGAREPTPSGGRTRASTSIEG